ncbi:hypothetical protein V1477_020630 [Vespula maculifrons]|uniref:Uncharacterized protein n=1 Tax=Vespula maculifrons TaxID=7453 RepID=A0ABD2APK4_VESMC
MQKVRISERSTLGHPVTSSSLEHLKKKEDRSSQEVEVGGVREEKRKEEKRREEKRREEKRREGRAEREAKKKKRFQRGEASEKAREELEEVNTSKKKLQKNVAEKHQGQVPKALTKI